MIRAATMEDAGAIGRIYNHYVQTSTVTFEVDPVTAQEMAGRIAEVASASLPWLVYELDGEVVGFAYGSNWKGRCAYRYSVETTVYLAPSVGRRGFGSALVEALLVQLKNRGFHTAISGIALPNEASIALHEKFGMTNVAHFKQVGFKFDRWIDVGYWQIML